VHHARTLPSARIGRDDFAEGHGGGSHLGDFGAHPGDVKLVREGGVSVAQAARDLDVQENALLKRVKILQPTRSTPSPARADEVGAAGDGAAAA
jgi:hypothetical protein